MSLTRNRYWVLYNKRIRKGTACTESQCLYSTAIPLLPLWAVRPVQTLSACTVNLYLYSLYGPYGLCRPSVLVQQIYTSTPPKGRTACTDPQCLYSTAILLLPYGAYSLYSASVPVQYSYTSTPPMGRSACTEHQCLYSTAISLLPLWAVRSVQTLSACKVELYLYSPYGPCGLYRSSVPVQYSYISTPPMGRAACTEPQYLYSTAISLLSLWVVRPVQSLSTCTVQLYLYFPHRPTACTDPQCL